MYLECLFESGMFPPRSLALFYASLYPHILDEETGEGGISEAVRASAIWAFQRIYGRKMGSLSQEAIYEMNRIYSKEFGWSQKHENQLKLPAEKEGIYIPLKDAVYTDYYQEKKIEDWADSAHKKVVKAVVKRILADPQLLKEVRENNSITTIKDSIRG